MPSSVVSTATTSEGGSKSPSRKSKKGQTTIVQPAPMRTTVKSSKTVSLAQSSVASEASKEPPQPPAAVDLAAQTVSSNKYSEVDGPSSTAGAKVASSKLRSANSEYSTPNFSAVSSSVGASSSVRPTHKTAPKTAPMPPVKSSGGGRAALTAIDLANDGSVFSSTVKNGQYFLFVNHHFLISCLELFVHRRLSSGVGDAHGPRRRERKAGRDGNLYSREGRAQIDAARWIILKLIFFLLFLQPLKKVTFQINK